MNLIPSSYAAVSNNPNLHLIVHIIGTLRGNIRSGNARHVPGANEGSARKLGLWIAMGLDFSDDAYMWYRTNDIAPHEYPPSLLFLQGFFTVIPQLGFLRLFHSSKVFNI